MDPLQEALDRAIAGEVKAYGSYAKDDPYYDPTGFMRTNSNTIAWNPASYGSSTVSHVSLHTTKPKENKVNAEVRVVRLKAGFVGQVLIAGGIAWESTPRKKHDKAHKAAADHIVEVFA